MLEFLQIQVASFWSWWGWECCRHLTGSSWQLESPPGRVCASGYHFQTGNLSVVFLEEWGWESVLENPYLEGEGEEEEEEGEEFELLVWE